MKKTIGKKLKLAAGILLVGLMSAGVSWAATAPTVIYQGAIGEGLGKPGPAAVDYKNNIFVTYPANKVVRIFSPDGKLIKTFDRAADGSNLFNLPASVAADLTGKVFVGDKDRVAVLDLNDPNYLRYLGAGAGEFVSVQALAVYNPYNSAADPGYMQNPLILVADCSGGVGYIKGYNLAGNDYIKVPIYDSNADGIPDADFPLPNIDKYGVPNVLLVTGMAVDNVKKTLFITDKLNCKIDEYWIKDFTLVRTSNFSGNFMGAGKVIDLVGVAVDTADRLYFALGYNSYIQVWDRNAAAYNNPAAKLCNIGLRGTGVAQMWQPAGLLIDFQKRLIVSDHENSRLLLFLLDAGPPVPYSAPDRPVLLDPLNKIVGTQPSLTVTNLYEYNGNAVDYTIEVALDQNFNNIVKTFTGNITPPVTSATVSDWGGTTLAFNQYWWRAKAKNSAIPSLESDWSETGSFYVNDPAVNWVPATPLLKAPAYNSIVGMETLLEWYAAQNAPDAFDTMKYTVEVFDNTPRHAVVATKTDITSCGVALQDLTGYSRLMERRLYSWRVKAANSFGIASAWSSQRTFRLVRSGVRIRALPRTRVYTDGNDAYLGEYRGFVPANRFFTAELEPGYHVVRLQKAGYNPYYALVKVFSKTLTAVLAAQKPVAEPLTASTLSIPQAVTLPADYNPQGAKPFVVDWLDDGVKELLVGESNGNITLLSPTNAASPGFQSPVLLTNIGSAAAPFVIDWYNNGVKNILVGDGSGRIRFYYSKDDLAAGSYTELTDTDNAPLAVPAGPAVPWVVDWNNDGKKDLLAGAGDGYVYLFLNTGTDSDPQLVSQGRIKFADNADLIVDSFKNAAPLTVHWDIDGNMDLLVGYSNGQVFLFRNESSSNNPVFNNYMYTPLLASNGTPLGDYLGAGASPFVVIWKWGTNTVMDLLLGSELNGLWAARLNNLQ